MQSRLGEHDVTSQVEGRAQGETCLSKEREARHTCEVDKGLSKKSGNDSPAAFFLLFVVLLLFAYLCFSLLFFAAF